MLFVLFLSFSHYVVCSFSFFSPLSNNIMGKRKKRDKQHNGEKKEKEQTT
jgi:hypothetical protein